MSLSDRIPGMNPGSRLRNLAVGFVYIIVIFGLIGAAAPGSPDPQQQQATAPSTDSQNPTTTAPPATTTAAAQTTPAGTTSTTSPTTSTTTTTTTATTVQPAEDAASYSFSGSGNAVTDSFSTAGGLVVVDTEYAADSNYIVKAVNSQGDERLLVNTIGNYDGQIALHLPEGEWRLDVTSSGQWTAEITQPRYSSAELEALPETGSGDHAAFFGPFQFEGSTTVSFEINNDAHAAVWLTQTNGERVQLLHNKIGPYQGEALVTESGAGLIVVESNDAEWRIEIGG